MCRLISMGWLCLFACVVMTSPTTAHAEMLRVSFTDPLGDHTGGIDIVGFDLTFDNTTGDYQVLFRADSSGPFAGLFQIDVSLFNADAGSSTADTSFFQASKVNAAPAIFPPPTRSGFSGNSAVLRSWNLGDRIAASDLPFGVPDDLGEAEFRTVLLSGLLPDPIGGPNFDPSVGDQIASGNVVATIVPEPSGLVPAVIGCVLIVLFFFGRRCRVRTGRTAFSR